MDSECPRLFQCLPLKFCVAETLGLCLKNHLATSMVFDKKTLCNLLRRSMQPVYCMVWWYGGRPLWCVFIQRHCTFYIAHHYITQNA